VAPLDPEKWKRAEELFLGALEVPPEERGEWLATRCGDEALRAEVAGMLAADDAGAARIEGVVAEASKDIESPKDQGLTGSRLMSPDTMSPGMMGPGMMGPGMRIGNYIVVREIGRGGMGEVYHAVRADGEFHQAVAIKVIAQELRSDVAQQRFRQERHILARLDHPSIARLFDGGTTPDGRPYLVMELVDGLPITRYCKLHRMERTAILQLFLDVCQGVEHAHQRQVVHRDLKPGNILVTPEGRPKLLDFGIAKWLDPELSPETVVRTAPGFAALTPDYASPEQHRGEPQITERADIFALGAILFELLTGRRAVAFGRTERLGMVGNLGPVIERALALDAADRYPTVQALMEDLHAVSREAANEAAPSAPPVEGQQLAADRLSTRRTLLIGASAGAAVSLLAVAGGWWWYGRQDRREVRSIAVLPFVNLGSQQDEEQIADGLTEDLITELALIPDIKVPSRTAIWQYRGKAFDPREVARSLGVHAVLEGSVRRSGDRVRVVAQLISVRDGFHLWAQNYDRVEADALSIQTEVSGLIASDLRTRLQGTTPWNAAGRAEPNSAAQQAYLEGYQLFHMDAIRNDWREDQEGGLPPRLQASIDAFQRATELDTHFAGAWAGLAEVCEWAAHLQASLRQELCDRSRASARKALELEPTNALATATLGMIALTHEWQLGKAEPLLRQAVALRPRETGLYADYADCLAALDRTDEAVVVLERVRLLEPGVARPAGRLAVLMANLGQRDRAISYANAALAVEPRNRHAHWAMAYCEEQQGDLERAEASYRQLLEMHPTEDRTLASLGSLLARVDKRGEAILIAGRLRDMTARNRRREVFEALVRMGLGDRRTTLTLLEQAWERKDPNLLFLHQEARFRPLQNEARFQAVLQNLFALRS